MEPALGAGAGFGAVMPFAGGVELLGVGAALGVMPLDPVASGDDVFGDCIAPGMVDEVLGMVEVDGVVAELLTPELVAALGIEPEPVVFWARIAERWWGEAFT